MSNYSDWSDRANAAGGRLVVWIEQAASKELQAVNSNGVCRAIATNWLNAYRGYRYQRSDFVNSFRVYSQKGILDSSAVQIPEEYIEDQALYGALVETYNTQLNFVRGQAGKNLPSATRSQLVRNLKELNRSFWGEGAIVKRYRDQSFTQGLATLDVQTPGYYLFSFSTGTPGVGHMVGFEFRPDVQVSSAFPQLHEFIDANLGLFAFPSAEKLSAFVTSEVFPIYRGDANPRCITTARYDTGKGGLGDPEMDQEAEAELAALTLEEK